MKFKMYPGLKRDFLILVGLFVLLILVNTSC